MSAPIPPSMPEDTSWEAVRWIVEGIVGFFSFVSGLVAKYTYSEILRLRDDVDKVRKEQIIWNKDTHEAAGKGDESLWTALEAIRTKQEQMVTKDEMLRLQTAMQEDRRIAAADRSQIAVMMASKEELSRQLDRLYEKLMKGLGA